MHLEEIRVEYRQNPLGIDEKHPRFSWKFAQDEYACNIFQENYEIEVWKDDVSGQKVWSTGVVESRQSILIPYEGKALEPCTRYVCRISARDSSGRISEGFTSFETGLMHPENMKASWICTQTKRDQDACPVFFKSFKLKKPLRKARIYASALGLYEIVLNGRKVGDTWLCPGWTSYSHRIQYQSYDITDCLRHADVCDLQVIVADGWYKGPYGFAMRRNIYGDETALLMEVHLVYEDGSHQIISTDESWLSGSGCIESSQIYLGEKQDTTRNPEAFEGVRIVDYTKETLVSQECEPVRITRRFPVKETIITPKGEIVLDFGQNLAGFAEFMIKGKKGQRVRIRHAETLDRDGCFYPDTLRQAVSVDEYILDGSLQKLHPHFTFHGFRYICIEGLENEQIHPEWFQACALHSDLQQTGYFECSNPLVNQLQSNIEWGMRSNFLDIPTDCPQRDERLGWTGDAQIFAPTACMNMNTALFFKKWLRDLKSEQTAAYGIPQVVPNILGNQGGAAAWGDAAVIIPWEVYKAYGDKQVLEEQYDSMKGWVDYIRQRCQKNGLWQSGFQFGDWLALDKEEGADRTGSTDKYMAASAWYIRSVEITAQAAEILGNEEDARELKCLHESLKDAFNREYITQTGRLVSETQTGCILPLYFDIARDEYKDRIVQTLAANIESHRNHLTTGFMGTPFICLCLCEAGRQDLAGMIFMQEDYPGWLYAVKKGATTIWERWDSIKPDGTFDESGMNSLNHYANGSIGQWLYQKVAGLEPLSAGYSSFVVEPEPIEGIEWVKSAFETPYGKIEISWSCLDHVMEVDVSVPVNTECVLIMPESREVCHLGSGRHHFSYETSLDLKARRFTMNSTLQSVLEEPLAYEMFNRLAPDMLSGGMLYFAGRKTLSELCMLAPESREMYESVLQALNSQSES